VLVDGGSGRDQVILLNEEKDTSSVELDGDGADEDALSDGVLIRVEEISGTVTVTTTVLVIDDVVYDTLSVELEGGSVGVGVSTAVLGTSGTLEVEFTGGP
jgi:predicted molibdopterin-dependent oxidoreductase YjgC